MSIQPLTEAERAAAEWFLADFEHEYDSRGMSAEEFAAEARDIVATLRPLLAAEFYEGMAEATRKQGAMSAEGFEALALLSRQSLSRPTSEEH